jgi:glycyl-tRNA synthetase alpha subunit
MEKAGTGGALFRNLYRDFLKESYDLLKINTLKQAYEEFIVIADFWTEVANLFEQVSQTKDRKYIIQATEILKQIAAKEKNVMEKLVNC